MASSQVETIGRKELKQAFWKTFLTLSDAEQIIKEIKRIKRQHEKLTAKAELSQYNIEPFPVESIVNKVSVIE